MVNKDYTAVAFVIDRSGSTGNITQDIEGGVNQFIKDQVEQPGKCTVLINQFDSVFEKIVPSTDLSKNVPSYIHSPRGMTALLDAIGRTVVEFGEELRALPENERPGNVVVVVATDGLENSSHEWTRERVFDLIKQQEDKYNWKFIFLAANQDAVATGELYGFKGGSSLTYGATAQGVSSGYGTVSSSVSSLRSGATSDVNFTDEDRKNATKS